MGYGKELGRCNDETKAIRQCWTTQRTFFDQLDNIFHFTIDACASAGNALLPRYWSEENDCRLQDWSNEIAFCNPPFSLTGTILHKAATAKAAVFLLPLTCLTTRYFAAALPGAMAVSPKRIKYDPPEGLQTRAGHPTLGTIVLLYGATDEQIEQVKQLGFNLYRLT